jgi:hypothetical protein
MVIQMYVFQHVAGRQKSSGRVGNVLSNGLSKGMSGALKVKVKVKQLLNTVISWGLPTAMYSLH